MNLGQVTADILAGQKAVQEGCEAGRRELRLSRAVKEAVKALNRALIHQPMLMACDTEGVARELELAYVEARGKGEGGAMG